MAFNYKIDIDKQAILNKLGLDKDGRVQQVIDSTVIHYLRLLMPYDSHTMQDNTRRVRPGLIEIAVPYAHYQNVGELYVNPIHNSTGYPYIINQQGQHVGYKGKRVPSGRKMDYSKYGGTERGPQFVERTLNDHFDDILNAAKKEVSKK